MKCGWNNDFVFIDGKNQMNRTVLTDVKLLCDSQDITNYTSEALTRYQDFSTFLAALSKCFFMIGYFIGGLIFGTVADAEGRWVCFLKQSMFWHFIWFFRKPAIFLAMLFCAVGTGLSPIIALIFGTNEWCEFSHPTILT